MKKRARMEGTNRRESIVEEGESCGINEYKGRLGEGGQGFDDLRENEFEELNATIDTIVWSIELRARSQYTQEVAILSGAHNQRQPG